MSEAEKHGLDRPGRRLALAAAVVTAAFLLWKLVQLYFGIDLPVFFLSYPAVMLTALYLGLWPGVLATLLAAALADYWAFPPAGQLKIAHTSDAVVLPLFVAIGVGKSYRGPKSAIANCSAP